MADPQLAQIIDAAWEARDGISPATRGEWREAVEAALEAMDNGSLRVAEKTPGGWRVH